MSDNPQEIADAYSNGVRCVLVPGEFKDATGTDDICNEHFDDPDEWREHVRNEHQQEDSA